MLQTAQRSAKSKTKKAAPPHERFLEAFRWMLLARTYLGSRLGPMRGRDGNIHRGHPRKNELAMISHLGAMISVTVGALLAKRFKGEKNFVGLACIGEGGMQTG